MSLNECPVPSACTDSEDATISRRSSRVEGRCRRQARNVTLPAQLVPGGMVSVLNPMPPTRMCQRGSAMALRVFDPADAATVAGWAATEEEARQWCGHAGWPVPAEK